MCEKAFIQFPTKAHSGLKNAMKHFYSLGKNISFSTCIFVFKIATKDLIKSLWPLSNEDIWSIYFTFCGVVCRDSAFPFYGLYLNLSHETYLIIWCGINQAWISVFLLMCYYFKRSDSDTIAKMSLCQAFENYHLLSQVILNLWNNSRWWFDRKQWIDSSVSFSEAHVLD